MWVPAAVGSWLCAVVATLGLRLRDLLEPTLALPSGPYSSSHPSSSLPRIDFYDNSTEAAPRARKRRRWRRGKVGKENSYANSTAADGRKGKAGKLLGLLPPWQQSLLRPLKMTMAEVPLHDGDVEELFFWGSLFEENDVNDSDYELLRKTIAYPSLLSNGKDEGLRDYHSVNLTLDEGEEEEEVAVADALPELPAETEINHPIDETPEEDIDNNHVEEKVETATPKLATPSTEEEASSPYCVEGGHDDEVDVTGNTDEDEREMTDGVETTVSALPQAEDAATSESDALSYEGTNDVSVGSGDARFIPNEEKYVANTSAALAAPSEDGIHEARSLPIKEEEDKTKGLEYEQGTFVDGKHALMSPVPGEDTSSEGDVASNVQVVSNKASEPAVGTKHESAGPSEDDITEGTSLSVTEEVEVPEATAPSQKDGDAKVSIADEDGIVSSISKEDSAEGTTATRDVAPNEQHVHQNDSPGKTEHVLAAEMLDVIRVLTKDENDVKETAVVRSLLLHDEFLEASAALMVPLEDDIAKALALSMTSENDVLWEHDNGKGRTLDVNSANEDNFVSSVSNDNSFKGASVSKDASKKIEEAKGASNEGTSGSKSDSGVFSAARDISAAKSGGEETIGTVGDQTTSSPPFVHKIRDIAEVITFTACLLPVGYSIAVHSFLSSFHERSFCNWRHWRPIFSRVAFTLTIWGMRWVTLRCYLILEAGGNPEDESSTPPIMLYLAVEVTFAIASIVASYKLLLETRSKEVDGPAPPSVSMKGKVVFVTGANTGIGLETARQLYNRGATVFLGCRSQMRALEAMKNIDPSAIPSFDVSADEDSTVAAKSPRLRFIPLDLTSNSSVREAAKTFLGMNSLLHVLILNAGVMRKGREDTVDGLEVTMAANHLGHFLLTNLLLPKLRATSIKEKCPSKVLTVSSSLYRTATRYANGKLELGIDLHDLQCKHRKYALFDQYAQSKLANVMFALELRRREWERCKLAVVSKSQSAAFPSVQKSQSSQSSKKVHPKLTPAMMEESDDDRVSSGYDDIVPSPLLAAKESEMKEKVRLSPVDFNHVDGKEKGEDYTSKLRLKLTSTMSEESGNDEVGSGLDGIVPLPTQSSVPALKGQSSKLQALKRSRSLELGPRERNGQEPVMLKSQSSASLALRRNRSSKRLRPKLTPTTSEGSDHDETGLGFNDIVPSPSPASDGRKKKVRPKLSPALSSSSFDEKKEEKGDKKKRKKKKLRRSLTPSDELYDDEIGSRFHDIMPSPSSVSGDRRKKTKIRPKLTPTKLSPTTPEECDDDDQVGFGYDDTAHSPKEASSSVKNKKKVRPKPSPASDSNGDEEKKEDDDDDGPGSKKEMRRRLASILLPEVDVEEDDDGTGFGFTDVASTNPDPPAGEDAREVNDKGGWMQHKQIYEAASENDAEREAFCPVLSFCLHPGLVRTDVVRDMPWYLYYPNKLFSFFLAVLQKKSSRGRVVQRLLRRDESGGHGGSE